MKQYDSFEIAMLIKEIYSSTMGIVSESLKDSGLTHQQIMIIKLIAHSGQVTISKLCDEMHLAKGTVSGIVSRMESMGYIQRRSRMMRIKEIRILHFLIREKNLPKSLEKL